MPEGRQRAAAAVVGMEMIAAERQRARAVVAVVVMGIVEMG